MTNRVDDRPPREPSRPGTDALATVAAEDAARLRQCLTGDGVAVIPTDTVYGLACNPDSETALRRIYELKRRPPQKPAAVMFFSLQAVLDTLTELGPRTRAAAKALLPGPVTLLVTNPLGRYPGACAPGGDGPGLLGLRVPVLAGDLAALVTLSLPVAQSSANFAGGPDPRTLAEVPAPLREGAELTLDGGELAGTASTVVDMSGYEATGLWRIVREGPVAADLLARALN
ncbi:MAG TPA: Sua5/YciO/YrdC/YwlC family protein [Solirubrobacteraceae bacterium]|jgi:L-threonylcarbamoyladenylate synthase|nr:Sua5/YciO/YrdC/YwlC family protein [Solirubrobacteraceae bacterium]